MRGGGDQNMVSPPGVKNAVLHPITPMHGFKNLSYFVIEIKIYAYSSLVNF